MKKYKDIPFSEDFQILSGKSEYEFKMKKPSYWWLWIVGLIAFLLLCCVRCEHSIAVKTVDSESGDELVCDSLTISYTSHYLYKDGRFFVNEHQTYTKAPESDGAIHFEDMPCSVFSYIFYAFSEADYTVESGCYVLADSPTSGLFHYKWAQTLKLSPKTSEVVLIVIDRETEEPLADALLEYSYVKGGKTINDSIKSDAAGRCNITDVPTCGNINISRASCYAYEDITIISIAVIDAISDDDAATIALTPVKESFTFFVQNKFTHQPIPEAKVEVVLKNKNNVVRHGPISTNVDGTGRGGYNDAFIGATLELRASKTNYKDSIYTPICTVKEFIDKPDSLRIIYLEPLPYNQTFVNADSISHEPIAGVMNHIVVKSIDGNEYKYDEPSNRQGVFTFKAMEGDHIVIDSKLAPQYEPKHTEIAKFEKGDTIFMKPNIVNLTFRTLLESNGSLLPDCDILITTSKSGVSIPTNSGNGEFIISGLFPYEKISIISSKSGYETNDYTICDYLVSDLIYAPDSWRDIPMVQEVLPCDGGATVDPNVDGVFHQRTYNMGMQSGHTTVDISFDSAPDYITIYDGPDTTGRVLLPKKEYTFEHTFPIHFTMGCITIVVEGTSIRKYTVHCPD